MLELLKFKMHYGRPYMIVCWTGLDAAGDTWEPLDKLTKCKAAIAAFASGSRRPTVCRARGGERPMDGHPDSLTSRGGTHFPPRPWGGGGTPPPVYKYVHCSGRRRASPGDGVDDCPAASDPVG